MAARRDRSSLWPLLVAVACAMAFLALAVIVNGVGPVAFDAPVIAFVAGLPLPDAAWQLITMFGGLLLVAIGVAIVLVLVVRRELRLALLCAGTLIAVTLGVDLAQDLVARPRPDDPLVWAPGYSFPSGHTFLSTVTYGLLAMVVWRSGLSLRVRRGIVGATIVLVALVGCSRIALGAHYPTDVAAGWLGGIAVLATVIAITRTWLPPERVKESREWLVSPELRGSGREP